MAAGGGSKAIVAAFLANLGIAISKFFGFWFTGSSSMLAEAIHSVADTGNQGLLLLGGRLARREADDQFQFGFGRERYFWSFVVALVLFSLGALFASYEGIQKIRHPHEIESPIWAFAILGVAIVLESVSFRVAIRESRPLKGQSDWWGFIKNSRVPELPVVLLEDLGALLGLTIAFASVAIAVIFDAPVWDGIGTLAIGLLLGAIAVVLAIEMRSLLLGESATPKNLELIRKAMSESPNVNRLIHLRTQHIGPDELLVGAKIAFDGKLATSELAMAINEVERRVREVVPIARPMYIEPDIYSDGPAEEGD
ncbi:cation diffusion facilitator family transporter [Actinomycetota bacterium]